MSDLPFGGVMESCSRWHRGGTEHFHYKPLTAPAKQYVNDRTVGKFIHPMDDSLAFVTAERDMLREALDRCARRVVELLAPDADDDAGSGTVTG